MKIKLGQIEFDVLPVTGAMRDAVLADPIIHQVVWRDVYKWDHASQEGKVLVPVAKSGAVPLPNGMVFFVPSGSDDAITKNESASRTLSKRVLTAVGAKSITDVLSALHKILHMPQKILPLDVFEPLNQVASYLVRMHTEFTVVELRSASRNLGFHLIVPGRVAFHHELTAKDDAGYQAVIAETPEVEAPQPLFLIPAHSQANRAVRTMALAQRIKEMQADLTARAEAGEKVSDASAQRAFTAVVGEWRLLTGQRKAA